MKYKKIIASLFIISTFFGSAFSLEIQKNNLRVFVGTGNDKFSNSISQNKDDQLTATTEIHAIFPYLFLDINLNSITNRGYKSKLTDSQTFTSGRYDELFIKTGTTVNLLNDSGFSIDFIPEAGFGFLGNFGMELAQNANHKMSKVDKVELKYEKFSKPFIPIINSKISFSYTPVEFIKTHFSFASNNSIFYTTEQDITLGAVVGNKTKFNLFAGYNWNQTHNESQTLKILKNTMQGFNYGFNIDTGFAKFDYITYTASRFGIGTISIDFMGLKAHNWQQSNIHYFTGVSHIIGTEFLENQLQSKTYHNFSFYFNNKYVSGFKTNTVNPSEYRYERDYIINTAGIKYEYPLAFTQNWFTPYIELGTGIATFGLQRLANQIPEADFNSYKYETKNFWEMEANIGFDIVPQGMLNFGNSTYSMTVYAGTLIIPEYKKAGAQIKQDTYRTGDWTLKAFEIQYGFMIHMGLDF